MEGEIQMEKYFGLQVVCPLLVTIFNCHEIPSSGPRYKTGNDIAFYVMCLSLLTELDQSYNDASKYTLCFQAHMSESFFLNQ
jgi:hypothetical protein